MSNKGDPMKAKIKINMTTNKIDAYSISTNLKHTNKVEHLGKITGNDKKNLIRIIHESAFSFDESLYEIFIGIHSTEMELLRIEDKIARHVCWVVGRKRTLVNRAIRNLLKDEEDRQYDLNVDRERKGKK